MTAHAQAHATASVTIAHNSKSFALASRLLPSRVREDAVVLYAWCRYADDAVDEAISPQAAQEALTRLETELESVYALERQSDPLLAALQELFARRGIPQLYPQELLAGMRMDVEGVRYRDADTLLLYCWRVAGVVGLMMCHVMGVTDDAALRQAGDLGIAMQLTNICRDVAEDWRLGRLYLPDDLLRRHGLGDWSDALERGVLPSRPHRVAPAVAELLSIANHYYASGNAGLHALPRRCALAIAVASSVYRDIGRVLGNQGHDPFRGRAHTTLPRKLWLVLRATSSLLVARGPAFSHQHHVPRVFLTGPTDPVVLG